jgi:hypothetical protein
LLYVVRRREERRRDERRTYVGAGGFVEPFLGQLSDLLRQLGNVVTLFTDDAQRLAQRAQQVEPHYQGDSWWAFSNTVGEHVDLVQQRLDSLTQTRGVVDRFHNDVDRASAIGDAPQAYPVSKYDFRGALLDQFFSILDLSAVLIGGCETVQDTLQKAYLTWQASIADRAFSENGLPSLSDLQPDLTLEAGLIGNLNAADPSGQINSTPPDGFSNTITAAQYQAVVSTFHDPRTQELMFLLLSTPTGSQFAQYLLYMGHKLGGDNFIQWNDNQAGTGGLSVNGYIELNPQALATFGTGLMASVLVHEEVETYYDIGLGSARWVRSTPTRWPNGSPASS